MTNSLPNVNEKYQFGRKFSNDEWTNRLTNHAPGNDGLGSGLGKGSLDSMKGERRISPPKTEWKV